MEAGVIPKFAKRRPTWEMPKVHEGLQLASDDVLGHDRVPCPKCGKSRSRYCCDCILALTEVPKVELPFKVSIITHEDEPFSKSTAVQVALLAPDHVELHDIDHCPEFDKAGAVVLFPCKDALDVVDLEPFSITRAFVIDCKWNQAKFLNMHPALEGVRRVRLSNTRTAFWRFHTKGVDEEGLCTVEAVFFFLNALRDQGKLTAPVCKDLHCFDNLLWYFVHQHKVIQEKAAKRLQHLQQQAQQDGFQQQHGQQQQQQQQRHQEQAAQHVSKKRRNLTAIDEQAVQGQ